MTFSRILLLALLAGAFTFVAVNSEREIAATAPTVPTAIGPVSVDTDPVCRQAVQGAYPSPQVATVVVVRCIGREWQTETVGTAVRVGQTRWVSAMHVFNANDKLYAIDKDGYPARTAFTPSGLHTYLVDAAGTAREVTRWRANGSYDIVAFDVPGAEGAIHALRQPSTGEAVTAYGPYEGKVAPLLASAMTPDPLGRWREPLLELNGLVEHGYSGGPILDRSGNLVGVSYAITADRTYAIPVAGIAPMVSTQV